MLKNSPSIGTGTITLKNDKRVLPVGKILRKTKLNELPQLINILKGDMSIIGPRPLTKETFNAYKKETQKIIKNIRPGLSGAGSIVFRNEEIFLEKSEDSVFFYNNTIAPYKGDLEVWYANNNNLVNYFTLIFLTFYTVLFGNNKLFWYFFPHAPRPSGLLKEMF